MGSSVSASPSIHVHASRVPAPSIRILDCGRALSDALCEVLVAHHRGRPFDFARTMVLVPGGRLAAALERGLIARARSAGVPLIAPTVVTPLMLADRFVEPTRPVLTPLASRLSWRETIERVFAEPRSAAAEPSLADEVARVFGVHAGSEAMVLKATAVKATAVKATGVEATGVETIGAEVRARIAQRMQRLAAEVAASMASFGSLVRRLEEAGSGAGNAASGRSDAVGGGSPEIMQRLAVLHRLSARRDATLDAAGVADRDAALRDAVAEGRLRVREQPSGAMPAVDGGAHGAERLVVLLADPEPVQRALLARLGEGGVSVEVCVHTAESLDSEGFPQLHAWESRRFDADCIPSSAIRMADGPAEAAAAVVEAIRAIPAPRRSDTLAVMAPDDETRRAVERELALAGAPAARVATRAFAATRLGTLLARLGELLREGTLESLAAFVRHDDVATWLARGGEGGGEGCGVRGGAVAVSEYRAATLAGSWRDAVVHDPDDPRRTGERFAAVVAAVQRLVAPLSDARAACAWARPLREVLRAVVGDDGRGAFTTERAATIRLLDRALRALDEVPAEFRTPIQCHEVIALLLAELSGKEVRGDARHDGVTIFGWLDAGMADEPHLVLACFADGRVPEGAVVDPILPDELRRGLGMPSSLRRAARDAWILDGILSRARARGEDSSRSGARDENSARAGAREGGGPAGASVSFVVPRRTAEGDPLRPSRFLLRVAREELPARATQLFAAPHGAPAAAAASAAGFRAGDAVFPRTPAVADTRIASVRVTAFKTFIQCPYLFQLRFDPRLRLDSIDERAAELDARGFGVLVHAALEAWGREEADRGRPTVDAGEIERALVHHLEEHAAARFPGSRAASVDVQIALARRRLERFARLQAAQVAEGWRIHSVETAFEVAPKGGAKQAPMLAAAPFPHAAAPFPHAAAPLSHAAAPRLATPGETAGGLFLTGRIDRVDVHEGLGRFRALDYKTSSKAEPPTRTHRVLRGPRKGEWKDLQLPLYRVLLRSLPTPIPVDAGALGYINLAPSMEKSAFDFLKAGSDDLDAAEAQAAAIVARILAGDFTPSARAPVGADDPLAPVWGLGLRGADAGDESDGDESERDSGSGGGGDA